MEDTAQTALVARLKIHKFKIISCGAKPRIDRMLGSALKSAAAGITLQFNQAEVFMNRFFLALLLPLALAAGGCERKPTDTPKPKTGAIQPTAPTSGPPSHPRGPHLVRI